MKPTAAKSTNAVQLAWWASDAVVYFVGAGNPAVAVKIGVTKWSRVAERLAALQSSNHEPLELLGVIPFRGVDQPMKAAEDCERSLHTKYCKDQRVPEGQRGYEWFSISSDLKDFIQRETTPPESFGFPLRARPEKQTGVERPS